MLPALTWPDSSTSGALHQYRKAQGSRPVQVVLSLPFARKCKNCKFYFEFTKDLFSSFFCIQRDLKLTQGRMKTSCSFFKKKFNIPASVSMVPRVIGLTTRVPKIPVSAISILFVPSNAVLTKKKLLALLSLSWREVSYHVPLVQLTALPHWRRQKSS